MTGQHPRLRHHSRKRKSGRVVTYYFYDMRPEGKPDVPLGTDFDEALKKWDELHNRAPRIAGTLEEAFSSWETDKERGLPSYTSAETKRGYTKNLRQLRPVFGEATWDQIDLPALKAYLRARTAKTQGNREMSLLSIIWNWARMEGMTRLPWPAAGMERSRWKNEEQPREFEVTPELFAAVYAEADQVLRDCMDIASATGMRLTDARQVLLPAGDLLRLKASKTGKKADFDLSLSAVLPDLITRRRAVKASHLMLLSTPDGRPVSQRMLRDRWDEAREAAAKAAEEAGDQAFATLVRAMYLRDMRKMASDLVETDEEAATLLQHGNVALTRRHYRTRATKLKPVR
jgi:hypothetical protein